jgi:hypothetical protein
MAVTPINTIKNWFKTGLEPTQEQFWDWLDSFRHKSEKVPVADIEGIDQLLFSKADKQVFETHLTDPNAHPNLILKARIIPIGGLLVFKVAPNENENEKEPGDYCMGMVEDRFINGNWNGQNDQLKSSYE